MLLKSLKKSGVTNYKNNICKVCNLNKVPYQKVKHCEKCHSEYCKKNYRVHLKKKSGMINYNESNNNPKKSK